MKRSDKLAILAALAFAGACVPVPAKAQTSARSPVMVKEVPAKPIWLKAEVLHFDSNSIIVQKAGDERVILTFTYGPSARAQIQKALSKGGYQHGDKVRIRYQRGQTVALAVRGKPSKSL
jgi:hypothetical protein